MTRAWEKALKWIRGFDVQYSCKPQTPHQFHHSLFDGVVLCDILCSLGHLLPDQFEAKPQFRYVAIRNIETFRRICHSKFHMTDKEIFDADMLYDGVQFGRVLATLSVLSQKIGGPLKDSAFSISEQEVEEYQNIDERTSRPMCYEQYVPSDDEAEEGSDDVFESDRDSEVYQKLVTVPRVREDISTLSQREHTINELCNTEELYVKVLEQLDSLFSRPLKSVMRTDQHDVVFFKLSELLRFHRELYSQMKLRRNRNRPALFDVFIEHRSRFLVYGDYMCNVPRAQDVLLEISRKQSDVQKQIEAQEKLFCERNPGSAKLSSLVAIPFQRILKYHLLLDRIKKHTETTDDDYERLILCNKYMRNVNDYLNEVKRDSEMLVALRKHMNNIKGWGDSGGLTPDVTEVGKILKDGHLRVLTHPRRETKPKDRYVFLFERQLLICSKYSGEQFVRKDDVSLRHMVMDTSPATEWHLHSQDKTIAYTFSALKKEGDRESWVKAMRDALDTLNVPSDLPHEGMELTTFKEPVICLECNLYLEGLITQGYKCGICEKAFHRKCRASKKDCIPMGLNNNNASTSAPHRSRPEMQHVFLPNDGKSLIKSPSEHEYVNIHTCPGFIGQAVKEKAEEYLCNTKEGTFLVRENIDTRDPGYRISFKYKDSVRHIKIVSVAVNERQVKYCFNKNAGKRFDTLPQLIEYYRTYPLSESFDNLSITLEIPFHAPEMMRAIQSWEATTDSELSFCRDQEVMILEKPPGNWWVGKLGDKVGHVPSTYFVSAH